jgi:hypothetical protein
MAAKGEGCVKTSDRNDNEQLCGSGAARPESFCMLGRTLLTYRCAAAGSNHVFTQPRWIPDVRKPVATAESVHLAGCLWCTIQES